MEVHLHVERTVQKGRGNGQQKNLHDWKALEPAGIGCTQQIANSVTLKKILHFLIQGLHFNYTKRARPMLFL